MSFYGDRITVKGEGVDEVFLFDESSAVTVLGRNKVDIYHGDKIYQLKGGKPMSIILVGKDRIWRFSKVEDILPFIFDSI